MYKRAILFIILGLALSTGVVPPIAHAEETTFSCTWLSGTVQTLFLEGCFPADAHIKCADEEAAETYRFCHNNYTDSASCNGQEGTCTARPVGDGSPSSGSGDYEEDDDTTETTDANAAGSGSQIVTVSNFLNVSGVDELISKIVRFLTLLAGSVLVVMILFGAFQVMTSGGNSENLKKGRSTIVWSVIGFAIILLASGVGTLIANILGGTADTLGGGTATSTIDTPEGVVGVVNTIASWMFGILMALGTVFVLYAAFLFLVSGGDTEKVGNARRALIYAIVALVIGMLAGGVEIAIRGLFAGV